MAEVDDPNKQSTSPNEYFNPLQDEIPPNMDVANCQESDEDADQSDEEEQPQSMDAEQEETYFNAQGQDISEFPFTPPVSNSRLARRERQGRSGGKKQQTFKEYKNFKAMDKQKKQPKAVVVIKERYNEGNALFSGLTSVDSDADLERDLLRQKEKKQKDRDERQKRLSTTRQHERYVKRLSDDLSSRELNITNNTAPMEIVTPVVPVKLEGSGRFLSLAAAASRVLPLSPVSADRVERRQPCTTKVPCPRERLNFFKTFAALINMGSHGKKQKETKEQKERFLAQRQKSSDEKLWLNYIWIGLQAWLNGCQPVDQEQKVQTEREKIPKILEEVMNFKVQLPQSVLGFKMGEQSIPEMGDLNVLEHRISSCSVDTESSRTDISETYHSMYLSSEMVDQQQEAVKQVHALLQKLDRCEQLFPTSCAFAQEFPLYQEPYFVRRLEALYLWLNITQDLCQKLKLLGKVLNVQSVQCSDWPFLEFDCPKYQEKSYGRELSQLHRTSIPEIRASFDGGEEWDEKEIEASGDDDNSKGIDKNSDKRVSFKFESDRRTSLTGYASPKRDASPGAAIGSPPDASTPLKAPLLSTSLSRASSEASLDDLSRNSVYRNFVDKGLKKVGLSKMLVRLRDILDRSLQRAKKSLEKPRGDLSSYDAMCKSPTEDYYSHMPSSPSLDLLDKASISLTHSPSQLDNSNWIGESLEIGLPSFRPTYMFLVRVLLEVIHEAIMIRLEQLENPIVAPSFLSIRQIIRECKDILAKAVLVKQYYQHMIASVLDDDELASENSPMDLEKFDDDMSNMFKMYFQYLQSWLHHLQNLPEASRSLKNPLEEEWSFSKKVCPHVIGGEAEAGKRFSTLAISLLNSIGDFLESGIDEYTTSLYDWTTEADDDDTSDDDSDEETDFNVSQRSKSSLKQSFQKTCRNFKNLFHEARERASKALGFAKLLRKDLEIAADFNVAVTTAELLKMLKETNHVQLQVPVSAGYLLFIPERITDQRRQILQLLNVTCGREDITVSTDFTSKDEGYLLMVRCSNGIDKKLDCPLWTGKSIKVEPTAETAIALSHLQGLYHKMGSNQPAELQRLARILNYSKFIDKKLENPIWTGKSEKVEPTAETTIALSHLQVEALLFVVIHSSQLANLRRDFEAKMGDTVELVNEQTSCHQVIAESLIELKEAAISLRETVASVIQKVEEHWNCDIEMEESERNHVLKLYRETMLQAYNFGFEYMKEVTRLVSGETRHKLGKGLVMFAKEWMTFVSDKCERGRGMRPRWANPGLEFLLVACEPRILSILSEQEYQALQQSINEFISHLIGTADKPPTIQGLPMARSGGDNALRQPYNRYPSWPASSGDSRLSRSGSTKSVSGEGQPHTAPAAITSNLKPAKSLTSIDDSPVDGIDGAKKIPSESNIDIESKVDLHDGDDGGIVMEVHRKRAASGDASHSSVFSYKPQDRVVSKIKELERLRMVKLREQRVIGRVTNKKSEVSYHINTRKVNFHWQKGNKIGEGQFGKVYCAVNMDTGELMAMKEMKFSTADMQAHFKEIIDEIKIFEGINHPNLVRYYGVEVHRTEMLVFMEYCDRGTLDEVSRVGLPEHLVRRYTRELLIAVIVLHDHKITEMLVFMEYCDRGTLDEVSRVGLPEHLVRRYTRELLIAVIVLHDHKIVHRDIKGANIFLTSNGVLKLGDFGCSVKLKNHTTMAGEVNTLVGTTAYMAPEVITRNDQEGHGRAADIWSVGCVVIEMASGKRPWHELESNYQIMFKVGMGVSPPIPENLGDEGKDFLAHCLDHDPASRWTAVMLRDHPFAKVYDPDDGDDEETTGQG